MFRAAKGWAMSLCLGLLVGMLLGVPESIMSPAPLHAAGPIDLNTATADQLKGLPGIGDAMPTRLSKAAPMLEKTN